MPDTTNFNVRSRKESVEIYDSNKKNPGIDKYMNAYIDDGTNEDVGDDNVVRRMEIEGMDENEHDNNVSYN